MHKDSAGSRCGWVRVYTYMYDYSTSGASTKYRMHARVQCMAYIRVLSCMLLTDEESGVKYMHLIITHVKLIVRGRETLKLGN